MHDEQLIESSIRLYKYLKNKYKGVELQNIIIKTFNISISTFYNWYKKYKKGIPYYKKKSERTTKITDEIKKFIVEYVKKNPFLRIKKIKEIINDIFKIKISKTSVYGILKDNNLSYKNTYKKINPYTDKEIKYKKTILKKKISNAKNNLVSVDEMAVYLGDIPPKGWSEKGKKCFIHTKNKALKGKRFSLLMASSNKQIISFKVIEKGFKTNDFNDFFNFNIEKKLLNNKNILLDNATIHKTKSFIKIAKKGKINLIYNIPYHSEFNPIENIFSLLRKKLQNTEIKNEKDIIETTLNFSHEISENKLENIFNHSFKLLNC